LTCNHHIDLPLNPAHPQGFPMAQHSPAPGGFKAALFALCLLALQAPDDDEDEADDDATLAAMRFD
jgi:hypothetical protein